jgi:predicted Rossmann fold flavoprotein
VSGAGESFDAIVLGAGAAGMMCAATAGARGRRVLLLDHADEPGKKILISGGGRCNFTNIHASAERFLSANPHCAKSALSRYAPGDFLELLDRYGIAWHEKTLGQLFCDGSARQIVEMLVAECRAGGVAWRLGQPVSAIDYGDGLFRVDVAGRVFSAPALVLATGGPSIPRLGATDFGYRIARQFGLKVVETRPALVPLTLGPDDALFRALSGVSAPVEVRWEKVRFREAALFTHRGLSGPGILQISSYWNPGQPVTLDLASGRDLAEELIQAKSGGRQHLGTALAALWPRRLAEQWLRDAVDARGQALAAARLADIPDKTLRALARDIHAWTLVPTGTAGYKKAEVMRGGVDTRGLDQKSMQARGVPGLHFIGEAVDVTGWLGGYNFQWAWASGHAAGLAV